VTTSEGKKGLFDLKGKEVLKPVYEMISIRAETIFTYLNGKQILYIQNGKGEIKQAD
jgi:hypothetical protein